MFMLGLVRFKSNHMFNSFSFKSWGMGVSMVQLSVKGITPYVTILWFYSNSLKLISKFIVCISLVGVGT